MTQAHLPSLIIKKENIMLIQRPENHQSCVICGEKKSDRELGLTFIVEDEGVVSTTFTPTRVVQGYQGVMHGGMICSLLDSAMTNCLFSLGVHAMTADLNVRFIHPVPLDQPITILGEFIQQRRGIYQLSSSLTHLGVKLATATAKFVVPKP
ncbi:PaaI family thioesterase [Vibrio genomosp. F6]|nr:PaaI family thioesterase [Vibrio genomosp. F6]